LTWPPWSAGIDMAEPEDNRAYRRIMGDVVAKSWAESGG
jgi:hypothetical protein